MVKEVTETTFQSEVLENDKPVLVDFWAEWCGPCRMLAPVVAELEGELGDQLAVVKLNVDVNQSLAGRYGVMSIPTLVVFKEGQEVKRIVGFQPKEQLVNQLQQIL